jgi:NTE family protein
VSRAAPVVGLALGSGSARGLAHIGVLRAIEEAGIPIGPIAGTSMGAVVGAVHAAGRLPSLADALSALDWPRIATFFDVVLPKSGLIDGARISRFVRDQIAARDFADLLRPFAAVAADLASGEEVAIRSGDVIEAVRASISVPGIFTPARWNGRLLVDGGVVNPVPVSVARALGAEAVIAVDVSAGPPAARAAPPPAPPPPPEPPPSPPPWAAAILGALGAVTDRVFAADSPAAAQVARWSSRGEPMPSVFDVLLSSINIMEAQIVRWRMQTDPPDLLIRPPLGDVRFLDFHRAEEIIAIGYRSAAEALAGAPAAWRGG